MNIRPFVLPNDLDLMHSLVVEGFHYPDHPEWSARPDEKQGMAERLQGAKRMWPVIRMLQFFSPTLRDVMRGAIAEEDGQAVGLVNFMRQREEPEWYIANVLVLPAHRRKGIARKLVEATLAELRAREAKTALLDVVDENLPALKLYETLGFESYSGSVEMELEADAATPSVTLPPGWTIIPLSRFDWQTRFELAKRITPEHVARYEPPKEGRFRMSPIRPIIGTLMERMGGSDAYRVALRAPNGDVAGFAWCNYRLRPGGANNCDLDLDPAHPELAAPFVAHVIAAVHTRSPGRRIGFSFKSWQPAVVIAAESLGCTKRLRAVRMGLKFK